MKLYNWIKIVQNRNEWKIVFFFVQNTCCRVVGPVQEQETVYYEEKDNSNLQTAEILIRVKDHTRRDLTQNEELDIYKVNDKI